MISRRTYRVQSLFFEQQSGKTHGHHHDGRLWVRAGDHGKDRGVTYTQSLDSSQAKLRIDRSLPIESHRARSGVVVEGCSESFDMGEQGLIACAFWTGHQLLFEQVLPRGSVKKFSAPMDRSLKCSPIVGYRQVVRIDEHSGSVRWVWKNAPYTLGVGLRDSDTDARLCVGDFGVGQIVRRCDMPLELIGRDSKRVDPCSEFGEIRGLGPPLILDVTAAVDSIQGPGKGNAIA